MRPFAFGGGSSPDTVLLGGNAPATDMTIGTNNTNGVNIETNNTNRFSVNANGCMGVGYTATAGGTSASTPVADIGLSLNGPRSDFQSNAMRVTNAFPSSYFALRDDWKAVIGEVVLPSSGIRFFVYGTVGTNYADSSFIGGGIFIGGVGTNTGALMGATAAAAGSPFYIQCRHNNAATYGHLLLQPQAQNTGIRCTPSALPTSTLHIRGSQANQLNNLSANTTLDDTHSVVLVDATAAARTITLPAASTCDGRIYRIKKIDSSANAVTVSRSGSDTIDGATTQSLATQWSRTTLVADATNNRWMVF